MGEKKTFLFIHHCVVIVVEIGSDHILACLLLVFFLNSLTPEKKTHSVQINQGFSFPHICHTIETPFLLSIFFPTLYSLHIQAVAIFFFILKHTLPLIPRHRRGKSLSFTHRDNSHWHSYAPRWQQSKAKQSKTKQRRDKWTQCANTSLM